MSKNKLYHEATAKIEIVYEDSEIASSIIKAITPDNLTVPEGIKIEARSKNFELELLVSCTRGMGSFISTIDDILSCIQSAEKVLEVSR